MTACTSFQSRGVPVWESWDTFPFPSEHRTSDMVIFSNCSTSYLLAFWHLSLHRETSTCLESGGSGVLRDLLCSPVAVVLWERIGDVWPRQQKQGPQQVDDAAGGYDEEGGAQRDSVFVQDLESKNKTGWNSDENVWSIMTSRGCVYPQMYLDDEEHCSGRIKGTVVEGDDGGAMSCKQVSNLPHTQRHISGTQIICNQSFEVTSAGSSPGCWLGGGEFHPPRCMTQPEKAALGRL